MTGFVAKKEIAKDPHGWSPAEWAFRWLWNQKEITCVLSGMNSLEMLEENARIASDAKAGAWLVLGGTIAWDYSGTYTDPVLGKKNIVNGHVEGGETPAGGDLTLWSIEVEDGINRAAYESAIADFNAANPGYTMTMEATENNAYKDKIREAMASGQDLPDVFFTWGMSFLGDFVDQGNVLCLDDVLPEYKEYLTDAVLANTSFDGKL